MYWRFYLISVFWDDFQHIPTVFQWFAIALLTILIPLAIGILQDLHRRRTDPEKEFDVLDLRVVLDSVFGIKRLVVYVSLVFVSMFFWEVSSGVLRWLELACSVFALVMIVIRVLRVHSWVKGNVDPYRSSYLKSVRKHEDVKAAWRSVWEARTMSEWDERRFFLIFSSTVDRLMRKHEREP